MFTKIIKYRLLIQFSGERYSSWTTPNTLNITQILDNSKYPALELFLVFSLNSLLEATG